MAKKKKLGGLRIAATEETVLQYSCGHQKRVPREEGVLGKQEDKPCPDCQKKASESKTSDLSGRDVKGYGRFLEDDTKGHAESCPYPGKDCNCGKKTASLTWGGGEHTFVPYPNQALNPECKVCQQAYDAPQHSKSAADKTAGPVVEMPKPPAPAYQTSNPTQDIEPADLNWVRPGDGPACALPVPAPDDFYEAVQESDIWDDSIPPYNLNIIRLRMQDNTIIFIVGGNDGQQNIENEAIRVEKKDAKVGISYLKKLFREIAE